MENKEVFEENLHITNPTFQRGKHRCIEFGEELAFFIAYIPLVGEACMECYIEAAREDEENKSL